VKYFFSIIIATLNNRNSLIECINSINSQSFTSYEVLISDGGSVDKTASLLSVDYVRNLVWSKTGKDKGIYDALNIALSNATGEWVLVLGSDDSLSDIDALARANKQMYEQTIQPPFYYSDIYIKSRHGIRLKTYPSIKKFEEMYSGGPFFHHQSVFFKRTSLIELGMFDMQYKIHSDYNLLLKANRLMPARKINSAFVIYSDDGFSSSVRNIIPSLFEIIRIRSGAGIFPLPLRIFAIYLKMLSIKLLKVFS